jgi:hypothetical protein
LVLNVSDGTICNPVDIDYIAVRDWDCEIAIKISIVFGGLCRLLETEKLLEFSGSPVRVLVVGKEEGGSFD